MDLHISVCTEPKDRSGRLRETARCQASEADTKYKEVRLQETMESTEKARRRPARLTVQWLVAVVLLTGLAVATSAQDKGGGDETGPYEVVPNWPQPLHNDGWKWGVTEGIWAESPDHIWVLQRGEIYVPKPPAGPTEPRIPALNLEPRREHMILLFDRNGKLVQSWEQHNDKFLAPHRIRFNPHDPDRHIWFTDEESHQVLKFTYDGKLVMTLGEKGVAGTDQTHFNMPTDIAFSPNGDFYVADGRGNGRVVKFSKDGKYLMEWGKRGKGPGEFNALHSIAIDSNRRIYVADRSNSRIQIFDENGKFLDQWPNIRSPNFMHISKDQSVWVCDGVTNKFLKYDTNGKLLYSWGTYGDFPGAFWSPHQFSVDSEGNLYVAEAYNGRSQKFRPKPNADPAMLIKP